MVHSMRLFCEGGYSCSNSSKSTMQAQVSTLLYADAGALDVIIQLLVACIRRSPLVSVECVSCPWPQRMTNVRNCDQTASRSCAVVRHIGYRAVCPSWLAQRSVVACAESQERQCGTYWHALTLDTCLRICIKLMILRLLRLTCMRSLAEIPAGLAHARGCAACSSVMHSEKQLNILSRKRCALIFVTLPNVAAAVCHRSAQVTRTVPGPWQPVSSHTWQHTRPTCHG